MTQEKFRLPEGPVIMSPDRLLTAIHREVIMRKPEEFKMACLKDIQRLFHTATTLQRNPFYAGFGNRTTDSLSYRSVGVPIGRIFTIDSYGEIKLDLLGAFKASYTRLTDLVDQVFPPLKKNETVFGDDDYSDLLFWRNYYIPQEKVPKLEQKKEIGKVVKSEKVLPHDRGALLLDSHLNPILRERAESLDSSLIFSKSLPMVPSSYREAVSGGALEVGRQEESLERAAMSDGELPLLNPTYRLNHDYSLHHDYNLQGRRALSEGGDDLEARDFLLLGSDESKFLQDSILLSEMFDNSELFLFENSTNLIDAARKDQEEEEGDEEEEHLYPFI